ncbi:MAG: 50S ribosomal protein L4 [Nanoarchaeota archaeon]|nr:50S ribosomal protein L4 [Nanoarchaeota archaeon]
MNVNVKTITGEVKGKVRLPSQFNEEIRPDLVKRAVLAIQSHKRQPYGSDPEAGKKYSSKLSRRRRDYKGSYGIGISRVPRKIISHRGTRFNWIAATAPNTVGGRRAHPPKAGKNWDMKLNKKERRKATRSALSATMISELVKERGHIFTDYPVILEDAFEKIDKSKELILALGKMGFGEELSRTNERSIRAGKGKMRGRKYKYKKGPLLVVSDKCKLVKASKNILGMDVVQVTDVNAEILAPGGAVGRLTLFTESAIGRLEKERLFVEDFEVMSADKDKTDLKIKPKVKKQKQEKKAPVKKSDAKTKVKEADKK